MTARNLNMIFQSLLLALDDYSTDRRGDIGSWVREAAMQALQVYFNNILIIYFISSFCKNK